MNKRHAAVIVVLALAGCEQDRGVGFGTPGGLGADAPGAETAVISLPGVRPIPTYAASGAGGTAAAAAYGGGSLDAPARNLVLRAGSTEVLLRQVDMAGMSYVVAQGGTPATLPDEIRTRTGCLVLPGWDSVRLPSGGDAAVFTLDCS